MATVEELEVLLEEMQMRVKHALEWDRIADERQMAARERFDFVRSLYNDWQAARTEKDTAERNVSNKFLFRDAFATKLEKAKLERPKPKPKARPKPKANKKKVTDV